MISTEISTYCTIHSAFTTSLYGMPYMIFNWWQCTAYLYTKTFKRGQFMYIQLQFLNEARFVQTEKNWRKSRSWESRRKLRQKKTTSGNFFNGLQKFEFSRLSQFFFFLFPKFTEPYTYVKPWCIYFNNKSLFKRASISNINGQSCTLQVSWENEV